MGFLGLFVSFMLEGFLILSRIAEYLRSRRDSKETVVKTKQTKESSSHVRKERRKESDLPEADQAEQSNFKKIKTK